MITILKAEPKDAEGMNKVIKRSWYATYANSEIGVTKKDIDLMYAQNEQRQIDVFRKRAEHPSADDITFVAKEDRLLVGVIRLKLFVDHVRVRTLYVHPDYVGRGIGTKLWVEVQKFIPHDKSVVAFPIEHTKSVNWYKKMGFVETGEKAIEEESLSDSGTRMIGIKMILKR